MSRSFTVCEVNGKSVSDGGRYLSNSPSGAARKAGSRLMRKKGVKSLKVCVRETTSKSHHKEYKYNVKKVKVNKEVVRNGVPILYKFKTVVKSA